MLCVNSIRYSFRVDEDVVGSITPGRGLRQGDPISPYIFILCAEGLSSLLRRANRMGRLHRGRVSKGFPTVSHLLFQTIVCFFARLLVMKLKTQVHASILQLMYGGLILGC